MHRRYVSTARTGRSTANRPFLGKIESGHNPKLRVHPGTSGGATCSGGDLRRPAPEARYRHHFAHQPDRLRY